MRTFFLRVFVTMFVIIDPVGTVPVFIALSKGRSPRARMALQAVVAAGVLVLAFGLDPQTRAESAASYVGGFDFIPPQPDRSVLPA